MKSAAKVGLLLVVFVGLFIGGYAVLGKSLFAPHLDIYYVTLPDAGGVTEGTRVLMSGVDIGTVTKLALKSPTLAQIDLGIKHGTVIPTGSVVMLPTSLIGFGDSPVSIVPPEHGGGGVLQVGSTLGGKKGSPLDSFLPEGRETVKELNRTMVAFRKLLEDQKLQSKVSDLLVSSNRMVDQFGKLAASTNSLIAANQAGIGKALAAGTAAVQDVHRMTTRIAELVESGKLQKGAMAIMDQVKTIATHADGLVVDMNKLLNDPKLREPINTTVANVAEITNTGKEIATNAAEITKNGIEISKNGVEISSNVATISKKAVSLTDQAGVIATKASEIEDQLKGVLDKVGGFFNKSTSGVRSLPKLTTEIDLFRQNRPGYWRTDIGLTVPISDWTLTLGLYDAFESDRITAEFGKSLTSRLGYRYGIYGSKPAIGVDYVLAPRLSLRGDAWDINDPRLDLRASYEFGNGFLGWFGVDRVLKDNALTFGIGVRR